MQHPKIKHTVLMLAFAVAAFADGAVGSNGRRIKNREFGFSFVLPEGFRELRDEEMPAIGRGSEALHTFILDDPIPGKAPLLLRIETMGGMIGRERINPEQVPEDMLPPGAKVHRETRKWKEFEVDAFCTRIPLKDTAMLSIAIQVPLKPCAIQVIGCAEDGRSQEANDHLASVLGSLEGPTNWLTQRQRVKSILTGIAKLVGGALVLLFVFGGALSRIRKSKQWHL